MTPNRGTELIRRFQDETGVRVSFNIFESSHGHPAGAREDLGKAIESAINAAVTEEREACAKLADNDVDGDGKLIAQAIRQRSLVGLENRSEASVRPQPPL